jgi:hypothetical protein
MLTRSRRSFSSSFALVSASLRAFASARSCSFLTFSVSRCSFSAGVSFRRFVGGADDDFCRLEGSVAVVALLCDNALVGELDLLVRLVEAIGMSLGVAMSARVDSVELDGDDCSVFGVDGCAVSSSSGYSRLDDSIANAGNVSASMDILKLQTTTKQTIATRDNEARRCLTKICRSHFMV